MNKETKIKGAFDNIHSWWNEEDIKAFSNGSVQQFFGKKKEDIEIVESTREKIMALGSVKKDIWDSKLF
jgi:hypothetical protein